MSLRAAEPGGWLMCSFCRAEVKTLFFSPDVPAEDQEEANGVCDICLNTVPQAGDRSPGLSGDSDRDGNG